MVENLDQNVNFLNYTRNLLMHSNLNNYIQVAALAPLALLLVLEAHICMSLRTSINIMTLCCGVVHHYSHTAHLHNDKLVTCYKDVSEHDSDCNGNSSAHVQGRSHWYCYQ